MKILERNDYFVTHFAFGNEIFNCFDSSFKLCSFTGIEEGLFVLMVKLNMCLFDPATLTELNFYIYFYLKFEKNK